MKRFAMLTTVRRFSAAAHPTFTPRTAGWLRARIATDLPESRREQGMGSSDSSLAGGLVEARCDRGANGLDRFNRHLVEEFNG